MISSWRSSFFPSAILKSALDRAILRSAGGLDVYRCFPGGIVPASSSLQGSPTFLLSFPNLLSFPKGICVSLGVAPNVRVPHPSRLLRWAGTHTFPAPPFASPFRTLSEAEGGGICCCFNPSPKPGCPFACHSRRQSAFHIGPRRAAPVCEMLWNEYFTGHHLMMPNEINTL